jgi:hypothetical protein
MKSFKESLDQIRESLLKGGLSDHMSVLDIANKHKVSTAQIREQISKGMLVEREHTDDPDIARKIARDHLVEDPLYYDKLATLKL